MSDLTPEKAADLRKPFPKSAIGKLPKGGVQLDYVGHAATTDRLLSVDPHWSWEPFATGPDGLPALDRSGNLWIRLTVCGVTRIGVGDGKSAKEVIGDAIRNGAMRFGVALDLWSKEELEQANGPASAAPFTDHGRNVPDPEPPPDEPTHTFPDAISKAQLGKIGALMSELGIKEREEALGYVANVIKRGVTSRNDLSKAEASKVIEALTADAERVSA